MVTNVIPIACAVPVMAPKTNGFLIVGITAFVNVTAVAKPTPISNPRAAASLIEAGLQMFTKTETASIVII
jgi:hypothetical protein